MKEIEKRYAQIKKEDLATTEGCIFFKKLKMVIKDVLKWSYMKLSLLNHSSRVEKEQIYE